MQCPLRLLPVVTALPSSRGKMYFRRRKHRLNSSVIIVFEVKNTIKNNTKLIMQSVLALIEHHDEKTIWSMKKIPPILRRDMERDNMFSSLLIQNSELLSYDGLWPRRVHKFFLHSADELEH